MSSTNCPFCDSAQAFRYLVESEQTRAIFPRDPAVKYHILLIPKRHVKHLDDLSAEESADLFALLQQVVVTARDNLGARLEGYNLLSNNGSEAVNQRVPHAHVHIFLRLTGEDGNPLIGRHSSVAHDFNQDELETIKELQGWFSQTDA